MSLSPAARGERQVYQLPLPGGAGAAIRSRAEPAFVPVYIAALGPANLALTGELAGLDLVVAVSAEFTEDIEAAGRRHAAVRRYRPVPSAVTAG